MDARKMVRLTNKNSAMLLLFVCIFVLSQVDGGLIDPGEILKELQTFARDALGVDEMQNYFAGLQYQKIPIQGKDIIEPLAIKLSNKFKTRFEVAERLKEAVEESYARAANSAPQTECCKVNKSKLKYDARFHSGVDLDNLCLKISRSASANPVYLDGGVLKEMKSISKTYPFIKWQYFGSEEGLMTNFPVFDDKEDCGKYDPRYRPFYVETATPEAKDVVLVIDMSGSMNNGQKLSIAREAAKTVLDTLNPKDQVGIVSFNKHAQTPGDRAGKSPCYSERLALAIPTNIKTMKYFVDLLEPLGQTQYTVGLKKAFSLLKGSATAESGKTKTRVIIFLTDGEPLDPEKKQIFETIRDGNLELNNSVVILTYGMGNEADKSRKLLEDIAKQNTEAYNVSANTTVGDITPGTYTFVEDIQNLRSKMATYYNLFTLGKRAKPVVSVPYIDAFGTGLLMSITLPCFYQGKFIGVAGTDINMEDLLSDITFFNQGKSTYAFMISNSGRTLIHPLLPAPTDAYGDPIFMDIRNLEPEKAFNEVFDSMKNRTSGSKTFVAKRFLPRGGKEKEGVTTKEVKSTYFWTSLADLDFSVGVVVPVSHADDVLKSLQIPDDYEFWYHRIDLKHPGKPCSHFGNFAAKDTTVVQFAPGAYKDPYKYMGKEETKGDVELLTAYMKDDTGTVKNPGLKDDIRDTVIATWKLEDVWLRDKTELTQYVVWRYIGTSNGVLRSTPASPGSKEYDPRQRPWYYTALANTGYLALTTPYLDSGGAGVVITAARVLYRGEPSHTHYTNDDVLGVLGADFPLTYFYRLLIKVYPKCKEIKTYSCFVMDRAGFLIMHEDFLLPSATASDVEYVHITEKNKYIAEDLIKKGYLKKKKCRDLEEIKKQSFYEVHLESRGVDYLKSGARCTKYQLAPISVGTNAYIGVAIKESFCSGEPCSCNNDGTCPDKSSICECPCSSPLDFHYCRSQFPNSSLPICPPSAPEVQPSSDNTSPVPKKNCNDPLLGLEKCFDPRCSERNSSQTCEGVVGCYWCKTDKDDVPLQKQYCGSSEVCFRGKEAEQVHCPTDGPRTTSNKSKSITGGAKGFSIEFTIGIAVGSAAFVAVTGIVAFLVIRHCRNLRRPPINKNTSTSTRQIVDAESPALSIRPPAPLPEGSGNVSSDENYEDPERLERSRQISVSSIPWPAPYNEVRVRSGSSEPPALPPARKHSTVNAPNIPQWGETNGRRESREHSQPPIPLSRRISAPANGTPLPHAMAAMPSTESQPPDVPKKKHSGSHVIPPPPPPSPPQRVTEERRPSEVKPYIPAISKNPLYEQPCSPSDTEKQERPYGNVSSPSHEPAMPSIDEASEQGDSKRPGLPRTDSGGSVVLDAFGYVECIL